MKPFIKKMRDTLYAVVRCLIAAALTTAAIYLAMNNGEDAETFKVMTVAVVTYFFARQNKIE